MKPTLPVVLLLIGITSVSTDRHARPAQALYTRQQAAGDNVFTTLGLTAPSGLAASPQGHDVALLWSAGQNGTGYAIRGAANGLSSDCSGASFSLITSTAGTSATDAGRYAPQGRWFCYQVQTTREAWTSTQSNPVAAVQLGFVASAVTMTNNGNSSACGLEQSGVAGQLDCGDQVAIDFNQAVNPTTGPAASDTVCTYKASNTIWLASTTATGDCTSSEAVSLGRLTGGTLGNCGSDLLPNCRFNAQYSWSNSNTRLTVTIGARVFGLTHPTLAAPWTFTPTTDPARLMSSSGSHHICDNNDNGGYCLVSAN